MGTTLSGARIVASNPYRVSGVTPPSASDGTYIWSVVGQSDDGATIILQTSADASSPSASGNTLTAAEPRAKNGGTLIAVTVSYFDRSNKDNWTLQAGPVGGNTVIFQKGNGGGH